MSDTKSQADFAVIRQRITMQMLLDHFQIPNLKREGNELRGPCPICTKGPRSFAVNTSKNVFRCFSCKAQGNVIDFAKLMLKKNTGEPPSLREAGLKIWEWFNLDEETSSPQPAPTLTEPRGEPQAKQPTLEERIDRLEQIF